MKQKIGSLLIALMMVVAMIPSMTFAETTDDDIVKSGKLGECMTWQLDSEGVLMISGDGDVYIGASNSELRNENIKKVIIDNGIDGIEIAGFKDMTTIQEVILPNTIEEIGKEAFMGCSNLKYINIQTGGSYKSVDKIKENTFANCISLKKVEMPDSITKIEKYAFYGCKNLEEVTLSENLKWIYMYAFAYCSSLKDIELPDTVTYIDDCVFYKCSSLESVKVPKNLTEMGFRLFADCTGLTSVTIPDGITAISGRAFENCSNLESVTIPDSVKTIGVGAFSGCSSLQSIMIPDSVDTIGRDVFEGCSGLTAVKISDNVKIIYEETFEDCKNLTSITLPKYLTKICSSAFSNCRNLESIVIPDRTIELCGTVFANCSGLKSIVIPDSVISIDEGAFYGSNIYCVIYGNINSYAHQFALKNNRIFSCISHQNVITLEGEDATCSKQGLSEGSKCNDCGQIVAEQEVIDKLKHTEVIAEAIEATCTEDGLTEGKHCSVCNEVLVAQEVVKAPGHKYTEEIIPPTCTEAGHITYTCKCGDIVTETINATGHTEVIDAKVKAIVGKAGKTEGKHCSVCNKVLIAQSEIPAVVQPTVISKTYNGKKMTVKASVKDTKGKTITTVTLPKGKSVGTYSKSVKLTGNYTGTVKVSYKTNPKGTSISSLTKAKKGFTVKWKKQTGKMAKSRITGYQYRYSTSSKMTNAKTITVKGYSKTSAKKTKLIAKKKYYVQVRTYMTVKGTKYYSSWSKTKSVKTK